MTSTGRARSLLASLRAAPALAGRVSELEQQIARMHERSDRLETSLEVTNALRDEVRELTVTVTEELNRIAAATGARSRSITDS